MPVYKAPVEETLFILKDVLDISNFSHIAGYEDMSLEMVEAILEQIAKIAETEMFPLNQVGDAEGCKRQEDGNVITPKGFKEAYNTYCEGGWPGFVTNPKYGGQGLPYCVYSAFSEYVISANNAFTVYPGLTQSAIAAINAHANDALKQMYLPKMIEGKWTGTMNLTEPQCGTDLGLLTTKAIKNENGSYTISGQKIFISSGEHDLAENIVHLVLARVEGAPDGTKGISLFIVPKFEVDEQGELGKRNKVVCGSIEDKMGLHGNATCVMNYDGAIGHLVGEENNGLKAMFKMMNEARLQVAMQGHGQSVISYQNAAAYAKERLQGRSLSGVKFPYKAADPIIVHPDVRRNLMDIKSFNEAARAFILWTALNSDLKNRSKDETQQEEASDLLELLTPVLKAFITDKSFDNCVKAQQVFGGHGYIKEWGMEQYVRDARIMQIYEGANGVQALDLVGRKLAKNNGRSVRLFFTRINDFTKKHMANEAMQPFCKPLREANKALEAATLWLMQNGMKNPDNAGAASTDYLHLMGHVTLGYMWALMSEAALQKLDDGDAANKEFYENKLKTSLYYFDRVLPQVQTHLTCIQAGSNAMMALEADAF